MDIDWTKIKEGFRGFEKLAVEFVQENEKSQKSRWKKTKDTRDENHDAILAKKNQEPKAPKMAIFVGYSNNIDVWWMEAKYSAVKPDENKLINRYRLDATIVSAILSENISKVVFVTNLNISAKTISDIRKALIFSGKCKEVAFYTKNHLEYWLLGKNYLWFTRFFLYKKAEYEQCSLPLYNCIEELTLYKIGDNLFQEPLNTIYTDFIYEIHFSIYAQKDFTAVLRNATNIELLSNESKTLELHEGINEYSFKVKIPSNLEYEAIHEKDNAGEYIDVLPISIIYNLINDNSHKVDRLEIIPDTALKIIDSSYFYLNIDSQNIVCDKLVNETLIHINDPFRSFSLIQLYGKSGIGKSFVLQLYKNRILEQKYNLICISYTFTENALENIKIFQKFIFQLFFPFIFYEDLDDEYVEKLKKENEHLPCEFWNFVFYAKDIEKFIGFTQEYNVFEKVFPDDIGINNRIVIFDDLQKLHDQYSEILSEIIKIMIQKKYPVFCIIISQSKINMENYGIGNHQYLKTIKLEISNNDLEKIFNNYINFANYENISFLFGSIIEIIYFIKYISTIENGIKNMNDFKIAYYLYKKSDMLKNEIISKFRNTFNQNNELENLCSCIYYSSSGIHRKYIYSSKKSIYLINVLLENELVKKNNDDFFVAWHDTYKEIYLSTFPLKVYGEIVLPFQTTYDIKNKFDLTGTEDEVVEAVIKYLQKLYSKQKFYSIYYILENTFSNKDNREKYKNKISSSKFFLLFAYFCYANTNVGTTELSGYDMFQTLYLESDSAGDFTTQTIHYIMLWEIINSLYEKGAYKETLDNIKKFNNMPKNIQNNWVYLFEWDYDSIKYAVSTIEIFIDSENGIDCIDKVPGQERLPAKDVAFSTYRMLLCNLTNNFIKTDRILRKYNDIVQTEDGYDNKTKYMYNFTIKFLDCINNDVGINEVISANRLLKKDYFNDFNRHIFSIAILAFLKGDIVQCENYRMEYIKTNRPMKPRQKAFQAFCDALIDLHYSRKKEALQNLHKAQDIFENKPGYLAVINHNIAYIKEYEFSLDNVKFYFGDELIPQVYYIDIRMLY